MKKTCNRCQNDKPLSEFSQRPDGSYKGQCKACRVKIEMMNKKLTDNFKGVY